MQLHGNLFQLRISATLLALHETQLSIINHGRRPSPSTASTETPGSDKATATIVWNSLPWSMDVYGLWYVVRCKLVRSVCFVYCNVLLYVSVPRIHPPDHPLFISDGFCCVSTGFDFLLLLSFWSCHGSSYMFVR